MKRPDYKRFGWLVEQIFQAISTDDDPGQATLNKIQEAAKKCGVELTRPANTDE